MTTIIHLRSILTLLIFLSICQNSFGQVYLSVADTYLPLAESAGEWSVPQKRKLANHPNSPTIEVRTKVIKHFGFTGIIEVEITNRSERTFSATMGLKPTNSERDDNEVHVNNSYSFSDLKPGYYVTFKMELRECNPKGGRKMNDFEKVKACQPRLLFPTKDVKR
jgi:hypothetical protein